MRVVVIALFFAGLVVELLYFSLLDQLGFPLNLLSGAVLAIIPVSVAIVLSAERRNLQRSFGLAILAISLVITASLILI